MRWDGRGDGTLGSRRWGVTCWSAFQTAKLPTRPFGPAFLSSLCRFFTFCCRGGNGAKETLWTVEYEATEVGGYDVESTWKRKDLSTCLKLVSFILVSVMVCQSVYYIDIVICNLLLPVDVAVAFAIQREYLSQCICIKILRY